MVDLRAIPRVFGKTPPVAVFDKGLQQERTVLSWERTAFSLIAVGALLLRAVDDPGRHVWLVVVSCLPFMTAAILLTLAPYRNNQLHERLRRDEDVRVFWTIRLAALTVTAAAIIAAGIVIAAMFPTT